MLLSKLQNFVTLRPGLEYANYQDPVAMRQEHKKIAQHKNDFQELAFIAQGLSDAEIRDASKMAFSGRLSFDESGEIDYTTGQYWPVEYRAAACAVLACAIWHHYREAECFDCGDSARKFFRSMFGRGIAARWFS